MNEKDCSICSRKMKRFITTMKCKHTFHNQCIRKWYSTKNRDGQNVTCPICRVSLKQEMKREIINRGKKLLVSLDEFQQYTYKLFYFLMTNHSKVSKHFRNTVIWNRVNRISTILRTKTGMITMNKTLHYEIFMKVLVYVMLESNKRQDTPEVTQYTHHLYALLKELFLFYKNVNDIFSHNIRIILRIEDPFEKGYKKDIMKNKYLHYLYDLVNFFNDYPQRIYRKPKEFHEILRLFKLCCVPEFSL